LAYGFPRARWVPAALKLHLQLQLVLLAPTSGVHGQAVLAALDLVCTRPELQVRLLDGDAGADDIEGPLPPPGGHLARRLAAAALAIREQAAQVVAAAQPSATHGLGSPPGWLEGGDAGAVAEEKHPAAAKTFTSISTVKPSPLRAAWDLLTAARRLADLSGRDDVVAAVVVEQQQLLGRLPGGDKSGVGEELRGLLRGLRSAALEERGRRDLPLATALHAHLLGLPAAAACLLALPTVPSPDYALAASDQQGGAAEEKEWVAWARRMGAATRRRDCVTVKAFGGARRPTTLPAVTPPTRGAAAEAAPDSVDGVTAALDALQRTAATHKRPALILDRVEEWVGRRATLDVADEPPPRSRCPPLTLVGPDPQVNFCLCSARGSCSHR